MSVKIRLKRMGSKKRPFYRLVATDSRMPRDGRFIETLGFYNPVRTPAEVRVDEENVFKWFERGATPSTSVKSLLRQLGYMQKWELMKQGVTGDELKTRVEAIVAQQAKTAERRESLKKGLPSAKAVAKKEADKKAAAEKVNEEKAAAEKADEEKAAAETASEEKAAASAASDAAPAAEAPPAEESPAESAEDSKE